MSIARELVFLSGGSPGGDSAALSDEFSRSARHPHEPRCRFAKTIALLVLSALIPLGAAIAAPPVVYHSPADDGLPPGAPVDVPSNVAFTVHLYIDSGSAKSTGTEFRCANGSGDDLCAFDLRLESSNGLTFISFTPEGDVVSNFTGNLLELNGGDPWGGTLGAQKIGDLLVQGPVGGELILLASQSVNSSLGLDSIPQATLATVPEPDFGVGIFLATLALVTLASSRTRGDRPRRHSTRTGLVGIFGGDFRVIREPTK